MLHGLHPRVGESPEARRPHVENSVSDLKVIRLHGPCPTNSASGEVESVRFTHAGRLWIKKVGTQGKGRGLYAGRGRARYFPLVPVPVLPPWLPAMPLET